MGTVRLEPQQFDGGEIQAVSFNTLEDRPKYAGHEMTSVTDIPDVNNAVNVEKEARENAVEGLSEALEGLSNTLDDKTTTLDGKIAQEASRRDLADINLQAQIDAVSAAANVKDIVGTKAELNQYDKTRLVDGDVIKVLQDESEDNATAYYRYIASSQTFDLIGVEGPFYTMAQVDTLLQAKQALIDAGFGVTFTNNTVAIDTSTIATKQDLTAKQDNLTAGTNIDITNNVVSSPDTLTANDVANVALSGSYNDLSDTPTIPTIPTNTSAFTNDGSDGTSTYVEADELATVATSGAYTDLSGTPTLATVATSGEYSDLANTPTLSTVAGTGSYNDLTDKPTILTLQTSTTDIGEGATLPANTLYGVYN